MRTLLPRQALALGLDPGAGLAVLSLEGWVDADEPRMGEQPKGALDRDIIRTVVRAHLNEVRECYNARLTHDPNLEGRVAIDFVIVGDGTVGSSVVASDTLADEAVGQCVAKAVETWVFPKPRGGGNVIVTYPFNFTPG